MPPAVPTEPEADLALSGRHLLALRPALAATRHLSVAALVELVETPSADLATRHAAGLHLGLIGDPRINADDPTMIVMPAARTIIGIEPSRVDSVTAEWAAYGVQRDWIAKESPRHTAAIGAFRIAKYLVTNGEYLAYVLNDPSAERPTSWAHGVYPLGADNQPVYSVSPQAADAYAAWIADRTGRPFRLPTEAEWEYAATGGDGRQYPWGETWNPLLANTAEAGPLTTTPVGIYVEGASPFGVADMSGNVEEYVADDYTPYPGASAIHDDLMDTHGATYRIARGGSYARHGDLARCARRHGWYPSDHFAMGFRLAESTSRH
jgi:toxoflavin biosynthesis protein ToxD